MIPRPRNPYDLPEIPDGETEESMAEREDIARSDHEDRRVDQMRDRWVDDEPGREVAW